MKHRKDFIYKSLCIIICVALFSSVLYGGDYISGKLMGVISDLFVLKTGLQSADLSVNNSFNNESNATFSPSGFGGGGYNVVTYKNCGQQLIVIIGKLKHKCRFFVAFFDKCFYFCFLCYYFISSR